MIRWIFLERCFVKSCHTFPLKFGKFIARSFVVAKILSFGNKNDVPIVYFPNSGSADFRRVC